MTSRTLRDGPRPETVSRRTESLIASVAQHHKSISAHQSQLLNAVVELDRRKAWRVDGSSSMVAWLTLRCGVSASTAREWVTAAAKLQRLPKIAEALSKGKLSFDQVKPLVEVAKPETDATLAEQATHWSAKQVRELAIASRKQSDQQATGFYARRFLRFDDRRRSLTGVLPVDQYAVVKSALVDRASRRVRDSTPFDQRMADALVAVCRGDTGAGDGSSRAGGMRRNRPTMVVHADFSLLAGDAGAAELDVLGPVSAEVARRLACDAKIFVSGDGPDGHSLTLGRTQARPDGRPADRHTAARQGLSIPRLHPRGVHGRPPRPALGRRWGHGPRQSGRVVRPAPPGGARVGMDGLGRRQRGADLPQSDGAAQCLDAVTGLYPSARRTASLMSSWRATLSVRPGTRTWITAGAG